MEFRLLGPIEVLDGLRALPVRGNRQRALLALLLVEANELVPGDRLLEELWHGRSDERARNAVQASVSRLRKLGLGARLVTRPPGYLLRVEPGELDVDRFERLLAEGRGMLAAGEPQAAADTFREALRLYRGDPLSDFRYEPFAQAEISRLEELRLQALEERIEADLALGRQDAVVGELEALVARLPLRERLTSQIMLAYYRCGRQADALEAYRRIRERLVEELGLEPGPALRQLERAILRHDESLSLQAPVFLRGPEHRQLVTVLVASAESSEPEAARDPEAVKADVERALPVVASAATRHGGRLERVEGGRLVSIFGVPVTHEDDALRAAKAAVEIRDGSPDLRIGLDSGEALTAEYGGTRALLGGGAALAGATSLSTAALPGEALASERVCKLARDALITEEAAGAKRLLAVRPAARPLELRLDAPMVGREQELACVLEWFASVDRTRARLVSIVGPAGIGKSRLANEATAAVEEVATVLTGRCLPYGEGITFWPLREMLTQLAGASTRESLDTLAESLGLDDRVAGPLAGAIGLAPSTHQVDEIFRACATLVTGLARSRALVLVFEDLHWAEQTLLDLVEHLFRTEASVLVIAVARPELHERRPGWVGGLTVELEELPPEHSEALVDALGGQSLEPAGQKRVLETAEGNPLFIEQLLAHTAEGGRLEQLPPTIAGLLAVRLERLGPGERAVIERAAIVGKTFSVEALGELLPPEGRHLLGRHLKALKERKLLLPWRSRSDDPEYYRFAHVLVQQAAYRSAPKALRAELHARFADWLAQRAGARADDYDEILAYHLEQAYQHSVELAPADARAARLAERAAERLAAAGLRALDRADFNAASNLLERANALHPADEPARLEVLTGLARALTQLGEFPKARELGEEAIDLARALGDRHAEWHAIVEQLMWKVRADPEVEFERARREAKRAIRAFSESDDALGLARGWFAVALTSFFRCRSREAVQALETSIACARRAGARREETEAVAWLTGAVMQGPMPAEEGIARCRELRRGSNRQLASVGLRSLAVLEAMCGKFDRAREHMNEAEEIWRELGNRRILAARGWWSGRVELLAGDLRACERELRTSAEELESLGDRGYLSAILADLARCLCFQDQWEEAEALARTARRLASRYDTQIRSRAVLAQVSARRHRWDEAERHAGEAVRLTERIDWLDLQGDTLIDVADVLALAGRREQADAKIRQAAALYERKGNLVSLATAQRLTAVRRRG